MPEVGVALGVELASGPKPELELEVRLVVDGKDAVVFEHGRRLETALPGIIVLKLTVAEDCSDILAAVPETLGMVLARMLGLETVETSDVVDTAAPKLPE